MGNEIIPRRVPFTSVVAVGKKIVGSNGEVGLAEGAGVGTTLGTEDGLNVGATDGCGEGPTVGAGLG